MACWHFCVLSLLQSRVVNYSSSMDEPCADGVPDGLPPQKNENEQNEQCTQENSSEIVEAVGTSNSSTLRLLLHGFDEKFQVLEVNSLRLISRSFLIMKCIVVRRLLKTCFSMKKQLGVTLETKSVECMRQI